MSTTIYTADQLARVNLRNTPKHVAIIPDGNRRWAKSRTLEAYLGHQYGADNLMDILKAAKELGVKTLTFFTFSTENWSRSKTEVRALMTLLQRYLVEKKEMLLENGIRLHTIGDLSRLPERVYKRVIETTKITERCTEMNLVLAINYGGRDDMTRAFKKMLEDHKKKPFSNEQITEDLISSYLDTQPWKDPDLLIRTGSEWRVSNFLLWQISYAEIFVTDTLWPDFTKTNFLEAIVAFQQRQRRLGGA